MTMTDIETRQLAYEEAVVGAMFVSDTAVEEVVPILDPEDFTSEPARIIYKAMLRLWDEASPIDQLTVTRELQNSGEFERIGGREKIFRVVESVPTAANAGYYADQISFRSRLNRAERLGEELATLLRELNETHGVTRKDQR
jgi:replicative DNA helicase